MKSVFNNKIMLLNEYDYSLKQKQRDRACQKYYIHLLLIVSFLFGMNGLVKAQSCSTGSPTILAKWDFDGNNIDCNGALARQGYLFGAGLGAGGAPILDKNQYTYCPGYNSGCGEGVLGSIGHRNTNNFANALCLGNFYSPIPNTAPFDPTSTVWNPDGPANIYINYLIPEGNAGCLTSFVPAISRVGAGDKGDFETQGVTVYRNGVQIYNQTLPIAGGNGPTFNFPNTSDFCSDGSTDVQFKIVFGLVHQIKLGSIGYDDILINGTCGSSPSPVASVSQATCGATTANADGSITLTNFGDTDKYAYTTGSTYTGTATYASGSTTIPADGVIASTLANPATPQTYTVRVFTATCYTDRTVTLQPVVCINPNACPDPPYGMVLNTIPATCTATDEVNADAQVEVTGVQSSDKVGISAGTTYTGATYTNAQTLSGGAYTFTGLPNPVGSQAYTIRTFNGGDDCFADSTFTINQKSCGPCQTACVTVSSVIVSDAVPSNNQTCYTACTGTQNIDLKLAASVNPSSGGTCGSTGTDFVWTFTLQNTGTMAATNIQITDATPSGLILVSANASAGSYAQSVGWLVPSLAAGATATLTVTTKALVAGTYKYIAELMTADPLNDPNSTPGNGVTTEDDYSSATITVTGNSSPTISKEFSPMQTQANKPTRLTIKIINNESMPVNLTADFIDNFPTTPAAMVVATTPNLNTNLTGVIATAGGTSIKIPSGTVLLPGLNQISVDVTVPSDGTYCNDIAVGSLKTTVGNNCLATEACVTADGTYQIPPSIKKSFSELSVNTNTNATLTITIQNQDPLNFTLNENFVDYLPSGLILGGATSGTCPNISTFGSTDQVGLTAGAVIPTGSCTIVVPVKSATAGTYCNRILLNQLLGTIGTNLSIGNQDIAEACLTVVATPCTTIDLTSITQSPTGSIAPNTTVNLTALGSGLSSSTLFAWSNVPTGGSYSIQSNPTIWTSPTTEGVYTIKVVGDNQLTGYGACKDSTTLSITVAAACTKPVIAVTTKTQTICVGSTATAYTATPSTGVEYKWYGPLTDTTSTLGTAISDATLATFTPSGTALSTSGTKYYAVIVNNIGATTCSDTAFVILVVNDKPVIADGAATICAGATTDLTAAITSYSALLSPVWTVTTADGTAVTTPTAVKPSVTTTYVLVAQNAAGCKDTANVVVTVSPKPYAGKDSTLACANAITNTLTTSITLVPSPAGGTYTQIGATPAVATISGTAISNMTVAGTYQFQYSVAGCLDTVAVTVQPCAACVKPDAGPDAAAVCQPTTTLKLTATTTGGTWAPIVSPANPSAAAIDASSGNITGLSAAGTYKFVYSVTGGGIICTDTAQVVVNAKPVIADGSATICAGETVDLTSKITSYSTLLSPVWTVATAGGTAVTTPTAVKPAVTTTYVLVAQNAAGCKDTANVVVTVSPKPYAGKDSTLACANAATNTLTTAITLVPNPAGGTYTQIGTTPAVATITGNNVTNMTVAGTYQFVYTTAAGCKDTVAVTVEPCSGCVKPNAGPDAAAVCQPTTTSKLTAITTGGTWAPIVSPANPSAATIDANGNITGLSAAGTYKFVYSVTGGGITCTDTAQVVVNAKPVIADGSATICAGETVDLTSKITSYSTLISPVWTVATAGGTAVTTPTAVKPAVTTTYVLVAQNAAGCKDTANVVVTVAPKPNAGKDSTLACANAATNTLTTAITLSPSPAGGTYTQIGTTPAVATITGNNVTNMTAAGTYQFVYTIAAGCKDTVAVTVSPCTGCAKPDAGLDAAAVCQPTTTSKLTATTTGGTWAPIVSPANPSAATIDANGNITGLSAAGTYKFVYSVTGGGIICTDTAQVVVNAKPVIADGSATICAGETVDLTSKITSYSTLISPVWTVATAGGTAVTTPIAVKPAVTTTYVLVAQNAAGCKDTANVVVTVAPKPNAGKDSTLACANAATNTLTTAITLSPSPAGGTYTQIGTTPAVATITGNNVTNMTVAGTYQFVYTTAAGCKDTVAVTVSPCTGCVKPNAGPDITLTCPTSGIAPTTATLAPVTVGGTWTAQTGNPATAIVTGNNVTGLTSAGMYKFIYSVTSGGQTCTDTVAVIVPTCVQPKGSLGDYVWKDTNNDGIQQTTEAGVAGVQIELYKNGTLFAKDTTDAQGKYLFSNLDAGTYYIKVLTASIPVGCSISTMKDVTTGGATDATDSDVDPATGQSGTYTIDPIGSPATKDIITVDAGLISVPVTCTLSMTGTAGACNPTTGTYAVTGSLTFANMPTTGTLTVSIGSVQQVFNAPFTSPLSYTFAGLAADGQIHTVTAAFSVDGACKASLTYTAPANCKPNPCTTTVTATPTACQAASGLYDVSGNITFTNAPTTGTLTVTVDGQSVVFNAPFVSPQVYNIKNLMSDGSTHSVTAVFSADQSCVGSTTYIAPANCKPNVCSLTATVQVGACVATSNTYTASGNLTFSNVPTTGTMTVSIGGKSQTFNAPFTSPQAYSIAGLVSDGTTHNVTVTFSASSICSANVSYKAPVSCSVSQCAVSVKATGVLCNTTTTSYTLNGEVSFANAPSTGTLTIVAAGKTLTYNAPFSSPMAFSLTGLTGVGTQNITATFSATSCSATTTFNAPNCSCVPENPTVIATNVSACIGVVFPTLTATVIGTATADWYTVPSGSTPIAIGTLSFTPTGTVANSVTYYVQARSTATTCVGEVSPLRIPVMINAQNCIDTVDLHLTKKVDKKTVQLGDVITYTIKVWNESSKNATGVEVTDQLPAGVQYVSSVASRGNYVSSTGIWTIGNIAALAGTPIVGDTVTLSIQAKVIAEGVTFNTAEITKADQKDKDSTPGNNVDSEDDLDRVCITTPFKLCVGQGVDVSVPSIYTGVVWKDAQGNIVPSSGNSVTFTKAGTYTFTATNGTCPTGGCCPVIVEEINCCPAQICIPFTIKKRRI